MVRSSREFNTTADDMEMKQSDLRIADYHVESVGDSFRDDDSTIGSSSAETNNNYSFDCRRRVVDKSTSQNFDYRSFAPDSEPNLNSINNPASNDEDDSRRDTTYPDSLDSSAADEEIDSSSNRADDYYPESSNRSESYEVPSVLIPNVILEESTCNVDDKSTFEDNWYVRENANIEKISTNLKFESSRTNVATTKKNDEASTNSTQTGGKTKKKRRDQSKTSLTVDNREKLWKRAEIMREKRKKFNDSETTERRLKRLAREAAVRQETRMYYETPEHRRKRLNDEATRKRDYRQYNETPDQKRKRLDREAERRRIRRSTIYETETPEQRRERLNVESSKRRESRLNKYAKETDEQRRERLLRDATRAREMRFTRSAIETEDEKRCRLVRDAVRKRELRIHGVSGVCRFTELQNVQNLNNDHDVDTGMRDDGNDERNDGHYLSNWMMWFQNTITQPVDEGGKSDGEDIRKRTVA